MATINIVKYRLVLFISKYAILPHNFDCRKAGPTNDYLGGYVCIIASSVRPSQPFLRRLEKSTRSAHPHPAILQRGNEVD
jgi:hypothetical protein